MQVTLVGGPRDGTSTTLPKGATRVTFGDHRDPAFAILDVYAASTQYDGQGRCCFFYKGQERIETDVHPLWKRGLQSLRLIEARKVVDL